MRVLVTGASGFVGRAVLDELRARGLETIAVSRTERAAVAGEARRVLSNPGDAAEVRDLLLAVAPQIVMHLAGVSAAPSYSELYEANVAFAANLLDAALAMPLKPRVVLAGSAAEYGPVPAALQPVREDAACRPNTAYGASKLAQTSHAFIAASRGLSVVVARLFNPIGPGMPKSLALGSFAHQIASMGGQGGVLATGDLDVVRDFMDVRIVAKLLVDLSLASDASAEMVNICTGDGQRLLDLTQRLIAVSGVPVELQHDESRRGNSDVRAFVGDPSRLKALGLRTEPSDMDAVLEAILHSARKAISAT
ncbi:GDP-4-dehydro-6-deoxy-D-mannose reductase [Variovorax boronicumulans]|uniref:NAD-dependent epimerase/dehydratase family protein n=1 Tax=Variovorax boronicumulans TaxID=436515 RepID=UPI0027833CBC|nr:NAD-dependent epimerase/dehydratase family protein [Variovorax boronicumulans]MDQ0073971.1 GDP-4-dehydro-6-deoxy-D-mannose reductase [Variovorax boronicumulans]